MGFLSIILCIVFLLLIVVTIACAPIFGKVAMNYKFMLAIAIVALVIFIGGKYIWYIIDYVNYFDRGILPGEFLFSGPLDSFTRPYVESILRSNLFLLNIPDLFLLLLPLVLIFDKRKNVAKQFASIAFVFAVLMTLLTIFNDASEDIAFFNHYPGWKYILIGNGVSRMPFIGGLVLALVSLITILGCKQYSRWSILSNIVLVSLVFVYLGLTTSLLNIKVNASGFAKEDWTPITYQALSYGVFYMINNGFNNVFDNLIYGQLFIVAYSYITIAIIVTLKNILTSDVVKLNYIYKPWYHNSLIFKDTFYSIDALINKILWKISRRNYLCSMRRNSILKSIIYVFNNKKPINIVTMNNPIDKQKVSLLEKEINQIKMEKETKKAKKHTKKIDDNLANNASSNPYLDTNGIWQYDDLVSGTKYYANEKGEWVQHNL